MDKVDFLIPTLDRPKCLDNLLSSIEIYYPEVNIYIADQGHGDENIIHKSFRTSLFRLIIVDGGLSYARNYLVDQTENKYLLFLEDDFVFINRTDIKKMIDILESNAKIGVVGGMVIENGQEIHFEHKWDKQGRTLRHIPDGDNYKEFKGIKYKETESVLNFTLFRREVFNDVRWDEDIKINGEHTDFFLRLKETDWKIVYTPEVVIETRKIDTPEYRGMRRRKEFLKLMFQKHGIDEMVYLNGLTIQLKDNQIITHR